MPTLSSLIVTPLAVGGLLLGGLSVVKGFVTDVSCRASTQIRLEPPDINTCNSSIVCDNGRKNCKNRYFFVSPDEFYEWCDCHDPETYPQDYTEECFAYYWEDGADSHAGCNGLIQCTDPKLCMKTASGTWFTCTCR